MRKKNRRGKGGGDGQVILLADLAPRKDVKGGTGKLRFGEHTEPPVAQAADRRERARDKAARRGEP